MCGFYILIDKDAHPCIKHMAQQLSDYIYKSTKLRLSIENEVMSGSCFSLGKTPLVDGRIYNKYCEKLKGDGFMLLPENHNILIISKTARGVAYGAYDYLERFFGMRFLTEDCEYIPYIEDIPIINEPLISNPAFDMRTYLTANIFQKTADPDFFIKTRTDDVFTTMTDEYGGTNRVYGRNCNHNFHYYVPFEKYGNDHPEFYRFFYCNGRTDWTIDLTNGITSDGKLDESMDVSVAKIVIDELKKDIISHPDTEVFNFTQEDGNWYFTDEHNFEEEKKYKRSGMLIRFCNVVVRKLNEFAEKELNGRKIKIVTFAYSYAQDAPVKYEGDKIVPLDETVVADENLIFQLAIFSNGMYDYFSDKQPERLKKALKEWSVIAKDFWFWGYDVDFRRYLAFYNSFDVVKKNVIGFKNYGISYLCINGPYESATNWQANIRAYMYRKLMWDTSLDDKALYNEYMDIYYGEGSSFVKQVISEYTRHFNKLGKEMAELDFVTRGKGTDPENTPLQLVHNAIKTLLDGENKIKNSALKNADIYIQRIKRVRFAFEFYIYDNFRYYYPTESDEDYIRFKNHIFDLGYKTGIDYVGERWTLAQQETEWENGLKETHKKSEQIDVFAVKN